MTSFQPYLFLLKVWLLIYNVPGVRYHYSHTCTGFFDFYSHHKRILSANNIFYWKHKLCKFVGNTFYCFTKTSYSQTLRVIVPWINSPTFCHLRELFKNNARVMQTSSSQVNKVVFWRLVSLNQAKNKLHNGSTETMHQSALSFFLMLTKNLRKC